MGKKIETAIAKHIVANERIELTDKYFYPFAGKDFILSPEALKESVNLPKEQRLTIINIVKEIDNIFKFNYKFEILAYTGEVPTTFDKFGVFKLKVRSVLLHCYIDVLNSSEKCIIFGVKHNKETKTTVVGSNGIDFCIDMSD